MLSYPQSPDHYMTLCHHCSCTPAIIVSIDAIGKSDVIHNLKITNLCGHHVFHSCMDPALLAGVDDGDDDEETSCKRHRIGHRIQSQPPFTPTRPMTIQAKHPYTAPEATYLFTDY